MNKVFLIGNTTRDVESGTTQSGVAFCRFCIAVNRRFGRDNEVDFLNIVCWRGLAETCAKYVKKGNRVCVSGSIQIRQYEQEGIKKQSVDIVADEVEFLSTISTPTVEKVEKPTPSQQKDLTPIDEQLPF